MNETLYYNDTLSKDQFKVDYPYYGLFGSAVITPINEAGETVYRCKLLNGTIVFLKKPVPSARWLDAAMNAETPLSATIGLSIDDFLKIKKESN